MLQYNRQKIVVCHRVALQWRVVELTQQLIEREERGVADFGPECQQRVGRD